MAAGAWEENGDAVIEMDLLPPRWVDVQDEVADILKEITVKASQLEKMHQKHVLPGFDDEDVKKREEREIERLTQEITRGFQDCQKAILRIEKMVREAKVTGLSKGDETMARNIQMGLAARVQEISSTFRKKQNNYLNKIRALGGFESPFQRSFTPVQNPYADPAMMESEADKSFSQSTLQQTAQKRIHKGNDTVIAQREQEINDIAKGIIELADIFKELQSMVIDQGTMLDRIDYNVERMAVDVKGAEKELTVATGYQKRSVKRKVLLLLLLLVIGMFVLVLIKPKKRRQDPTSQIPP